MYLDKKKLYCEAIISKELGKPTHRFEQMLVKLANNTIQKFSYWNPDDKLDCLQNGTMHLFKGWYSFDEEIGNNAFAYYTEVFKRGAGQGLGDLYKKKGNDTGSYKLYSIDGLGDDGMHNI